jgi:hypothetical protein
MSRAYSYVEVPMRKAILWGFILAIFATAQYVPSGAHLNRGSRKIEDVEWDKAKRTRDLRVLESFMSRFPNSRHLKAAERLWSRLSEGERSRAAEDTPAYRLVPESKHVVRAVRAEAEQERK